MLMGTSAMGIIAPSIPNFIQAATSAQQVLKLLDRKETFTSEDSSKIQLVNQSWELKFKDVVFSYPKRPSVTILDLVSFKIPAGKVTAVVGQSGSGKSTIISLLERWYIPQDGLITLDGIDIAEFDLNWLRSNIGLVQQVWVL
jgi:ATP-binding cassette subfamily B (MDR/TAP) protein 1